MGTLEIIGGILLLISSILIIVIVLFQDSKDPGLSSAIGGGSSDSYFGKNSKRTKEARLGRITKICAIIFFIVTILVNVFIMIEANKSADIENTADSAETQTVATTVEEVAE